MNFYIIIANYKKVSMTEPPTTPIPQYFYSKYTEKFRYTINLAKWEHFNQSSQVGGAHTGMVK